MGERLKEEKGDKRDSYCLNLCACRGVKREREKEREREREREREWERM